MLNNRNLIARWEHIDSQLLKWTTRFQREIGLTEGQSRNLAAEIASDILAAPSRVIIDIVRASPVPLLSRQLEIYAHDEWLEASESLSGPYWDRARVLAQCYVCFVYLKDQWFQNLSRNLPQLSAAQKCSDFLISGKIHRFRNAFAHGNWHHSTGAPEIEYWDGRGSSSQRFTVSGFDMAFWQGVSRTVAYATIQTVIDLFESEQGTEPLFL